MNTGYCRDRADLIAAIKVMPETSERDGARRFLKHWVIRSLKNDRTLVDFEDPGEEGFRCRRKSYTEYISMAILFRTYLLSNWVGILRLHNMVSNTNNTEVAKINQKLTRTKSSPEEEIINNCQILSPKFYKQLGLKSLSPLGYLVAGTEPVQLGREKRTEDFVLRFVLSTLPHQVETTDRVTARKDQLLPIIIRPTGSSQNHCPGTLNNENHINTNVVRWNSKNQRNFCARYCSLWMVAMYYENPTGDGSYFRIHCFVGLAHCFCPCATISAKEYAHFVNCVQLNSGMFWSTALHIATDAIKVRSYMWVRYTGLRLTVQIVRTKFLHLFTLLKTQRCLEIDQSEEHNVHRIVNERFIWVPGKSSIKTKLVQVENTLDGFGDCDYQMSTKKNVTGRGLSDSFQQPYELPYDY
ncbi:hypothetical protein CLF_110549 [Clonorchis sinensis]|uniref:Uncharacterized protein n=1 Tax=Clonorchis sinensis TaxID=79923 RepID=G7YKU5_CLOSI|nr:hypothetical protein CLF_110549 [Clonorchis sinensis]